MTLLWIVIYMARNPECQKKLQQEIEDLLGKICVHSLENFWFWSTWCAMQILKLLQCFVFVIF